MERKKLEALVWKHTHKDFKGKLPDGTKTVLHNSGKDGTCLVTLAGLTEAQLWFKLPAKVQQTTCLECGKTHDDSVNPDNQYCADCNAKAVTEYHK